MEGSCASTIDTRVVYGFKAAGKTSYIRDCIINDYFYKYGTTLVLCFQRGQEVFDAEILRKRNAFAAYYDGVQDIKEFCLEQIMKYNPDRIYAEMNTNIPDIRAMFPEVMNVTFTVTLFDWTTFDWYYTCFKQLISQMVSESQQVTFRGCPSKELLSPYAQEFWLMNHKASYLRQDPMGYHEKAFDLFVPYSLEEKSITISEKEYLIFWLDAADHPEHYDGKQIIFKDPLELRQMEENPPWYAGRVVMTCCMADLQFMSFELKGSGAEGLHGGWAALKASGTIGTDKYGQKKPLLEVESINYMAAPKAGGILQPGK